MELCGTTGHNGWSCEGNVYVEFVTRVVPCVSVQAANLPRPEDLRQLRRVRVPQLLGGDATLMAAANGGQLPLVQLLPQLYSRRWRAARHRLLPAQGKGQG